MQRIAVLMTCHNRCQTTLNCISSLLVAAERAHGEVRIDTYLVDDGSTDCTSERVHDRYPDIHIIPGNGKLYWCQGMRKAWTHAAQYPYNSYLWLNDDVMLFPDAITELTTTMSAQLESCGQTGIVAGSTIDPASSKTSYGERKGKTTSPPGGIPRNITLFNGNVVLVSQSTFEQIGSLSPAYSHSFGDLDYAVRAARRGIPIWLAPGHQGQCSENTRKSWLDPSDTLTQRLRALHRPTGCPPWELATLMWRSKAWWAPWTIVKLYYSVFFPPKKTTLAFPTSKTPTLSTPIKKPLTNNS